MDNLKEATLQSELRFKDLVINPCHRSVLINNNRIDLTTKEFDLLYFLAIHLSTGIIDFKGKSYVFGFNYARNFSMVTDHRERRSVCVAEFEYNADGTIPKLPWWG